MTQLTIIQALAELETDNDAHWTSDDLPRLDALKDKTGSQVTRDELNTVAKGYTRKNRELPEADKGDEDATVTGDFGSTDESTPPANIEEKDESENDEDEDPDSDETESDEEELSDGDSLRKAVDESQKELEKAKRKHAAALTALDSFIEKEETVTSKQSEALNIQAFQRSQQEQRAASRGKVLEITKLMQDSGLVK